MTRLAWSVMLVVLSGCWMPVLAQTFTTPPGYQQTVYAGGTVNEDPGRIVRELGDIDGDGLSDFAIGAPTATFQDRPNVGKTYVIYGERVPRAMVLTELRPEGGGEGTRGFEIINPVAHGAFAAGSFRSTLAPLGDIDGDGYADFGLSDAVQFIFPPFESVVFLIFGGPRVIGPAAGRVDLLQVQNGALGDRVLRVARGVYFGASISGLGDFNGDGFDDFAMSAYTPGTCTIEIYFGPIGRSAPAPGLILTNPEANGCLGGGLVGGSDINGDGKPDLHVCSRESPVAPSGFSCYVLFGGNVAALGPTFEVQRLRAANGGDGSLGFVANGGRNYGLGFRNAVAIDVDLNGDGINDLVYGSPNVDPVPDPNSEQHGRVSVLFGRRSQQAEIDLTQLLPQNGGDGSLGFVIDAEPIPYLELGYAVSRAGDVNGDGVDDVAIGLNRGPSYEAGRIGLYIVYGRGRDAQPFPALTVLDRAAVSRGFATELAGGSSFTGFGLTMDGIRDLDGDGRDELLVGASSGRVNGLLRGMGILYSSKLPEPRRVPAASMPSVLAAVLAFLLIGVAALSPGRLRT